MIEGLSREVSEDWSSRGGGEPIVLAQWLKMIGVCVQRGCGPGRWGARAVGCCFFWA